MSEIIQKTGRPRLICEEMDLDPIKYIKVMIQVLQTYEEDEQESQDT